MLSAAHKLCKYPTADMVKEDVIGEKIRRKTYKILFSYKSKYKREMRIPHLSWIFIFFS